MTRPDAVMISSTAEPDCDHRMRANGKVICDCFISALIAVLTSDGLVDGLDEADAIAATVHDVDNSLAQQRIERHMLECDTDHEHKSETCCSCRAPHTERG